MTHHKSGLFFAPIFGVDSISVQAQSTATFRPRDIVLVLDLSGSMNDDSELRSINLLGQEAVEDNIYQIWEDLGTPTWGNLGFEPDWVTVPGDSLPFSVTWRTSEVDVVADQSMKWVKLYYSNGANQKFTTSKSEGTWAGTGSYSGSRITKVRVKIGGEAETIDFYNNDHIRRGLGLTGVPYPYSDANWDDFIEYCRSHSSSMPWYDRDVYSAGYRRQFGILLLINFWNKNKPHHWQTPDLWQASTQPMTAVKDAVDLFVEHVQEVNTHDRIGLAVYNAEDGEGQLEAALTYDFESVKSVSRQRQAGHYHSMTNIGAGMHVAREQLEAEGRQGALKMIVLLTDGNANWVNGQYNSTLADEYVIDEAHLAADKGFPIVTISLGAGADTSLMQEVAEISDGNHFVVPGGQTVEEYSEELLEVFRVIAGARPVQLVH